MGESARTIAQIFDGFFDFGAGFRSDGALFVDDAADGREGYACRFGHLVNRDAVFHVIHEQYLRTPFIIYPYARAFERRM